VSIEHLVTLGETMAVLAATRAGPLERNTPLRLSIAGAESNVAIGVRRLGGQATWIGRVGADPLGQLVLRELAAEGVDTRAIRDSRPTAVMIREQRTQDVARMIYHRAGAAGSRLSPDDVPADLLSSARVLHVTGITPALGELPAAAVDRAVSMAIEAGVLVSMDVNYRANLWSGMQATAALRPLLARADIVFASEHEARMMTDEDQPEKMAEALCKAGPSVAVIKFGARGSLALANGVLLTQDAIRVHAVDTIGAGDAFAAGYLAELMAGAAPELCLLTAAKVSALAVSAIGDWEGLPRRDELDLLASTDDTLR
jgi:2-dehydro-3-deoxygluconokinase